MALNNARRIFVILAILTIGLAIFFYWRNIYSRGKLKLEILAPDQVELAQEIEYIVKYKNNGSITLEEPRLIFEYPEGSILEEGKPQREELELEDIYPGQEKTVSFKTRLLGKENESKIAKAWLSYRPKNLSARFEAATTHTALIKFVPLTFEFDFPSKMEIGREINLRINYFSNAAFPLSNLRIKIDYPSGFQFLESKPEGINQDEWDIGLLNKAEGGRIEIRGKLEGEISSQKIFRAKLVSWQGEKGIILAEITKGLELIRPSIYISWQVNGSPQFIANPGDYLHYEIFFKNIGENPLENLFLRVVLEGEVFDFDSLKNDSGQFQKEIGTIFWDQTTLPQLKFFSPLEEGKVDFYVKLKNNFPENIRNPLAKIQVDLSRAREDIITKINSNVLVIQNGYFNQGPFQNTGSIPPRVNSTTTYTITWRAKSFYNDLRDVKVRAFLPEQSKLTGEILPKEAKFSFDPVSREIVWDIGDLIAGEQKEIQFQIAFTPSSDQRGQAPNIISQNKMTGEDSWTGKILEATASAVNTTLPDDPTIGEEQGIIQ